MSGDYRPDTYWSDRLADVGGLRATGHLAYSEAYNRWLYRRKGLMLRQVLRGASLDRVVDLGSGVGWVVDQLLARGARELQGVDISTEAVAHLQRRLPRHRFHAVAIGSEPVPIEEGWATTITFLDVTYHIVDDELWAAAVRDAARMLEPGGRLVVIDGFGPTERTPASHTRFRSLDHWTEAGADAGLTRTDLRPCFRWLGRPVGASKLRRLPQSARGAIEMGLDLVAPSPHHLAAAVFRRR